MSFCPLGYDLLSVVRDELGERSLHELLAAGKRTAYAWDRQNAQLPLRQIPSNRWLLAGAEKLIAAGAATPYPFATHTIPLLLKTVSSGQKTHRALNRDKLHQFLMTLADGNKTEAECREAAEAEFGKIPEKNVWRPAWSQIPEDLKRARGRKKNTAI